MWNKLISWWEVRTRGKDLRGPLPIHKDVLNDRHSKAEIQVMSILALLAVIPLGGAGYFFYTNTGRAEQYLAEGIRLMSPGHYDEAVIKLTQALNALPKSHPNRYMGHLMRGSANRLRGERQPAREDVDKAIELRPDCGRCYLERAGLERESKEYSAALEDLDRAQTIERQPANYAERAAIYEEQNQPQKAIEEYTKAIAMREQWPHLYRARARLRKALGDMEGYEADKAAVIRIDPRY